MSILLCWLIVLLTWDASDSAGGSSLMVIRWKKYVLLGGLGYQKVLNAFSSKPKQHGMGKLLRGPWFGGYDEPKGGR